MAEREHSSKHTELYGLRTLGLYGQVAPYCDATFEYTTIKYPGQIHSKISHPYDGLPKTVDSYPIPPGCVIAEVTVTGDQIFLFRTAQVVEKARVELQKLVDEASMTLELPPVLTRSVENKTV